MNNMPPLIVAEGICKRYGSLQAVCGLSFSVNQAECFGFLGPNGAGKTSTMKMIYGKAQRDTVPATIFSVFGFDPARDELEIKQRTGVVMQDNALDEELNVRQNLGIYCRFYDMTARESKAKIDELLDFMELGHKSDVPIRQLSGGMQRRLAIARALLNDPELLILDEPTTGLDPQVRHLIWNKLRELKEKGVTIVLTTHYMEEAFQICDRILIMDHGKKMMEGAPATLLQENIEKYVLETLSPLTNDLPSRNIRHEDYNGTRYYYSNNIAELEELSSSLGSVRIYIRQANLEDVFLRATGRSLNEGQ